jgi:hypothetical protein
MQGMHVFDNKQSMQACTFLLHQCRTAGAALFQVSAAAQTNQSLQQIVCLANYADQQCKSMFLASGFLESQGKFFNKIRAQNDAAVCLGRCGNRGNMHVCTYFATFCPAASG